MSASYQTGARCSHIIEKSHLFVDLSVDERRKQVAHLAFPDGLHGESVHPGVERAAAILLVGVRRGGDDGRPCATCFPVAFDNESRRLEAVHAGHLDIHEHEVEAPFGRAFKQIEHIQAVPGALDRGARRSDDLLRYLADDLVVFRK